MQNHLEISSKYHFGTRNVRNLSKSLYGKFTESIRNLPRPPRPVQEGPYGPIWAPTRTGPQPGLGPNPARARSLYDEDFAFHRKKYSALFSLQEVRRAPLDEIMEAILLAPINGT